MVRTTSTAAAAATVAAVIAATALGLAPHQAQAAPVTEPTATAADASSDLRFHDIPGSGGITLKGNVFTPRAPGQARSIR